MKIFLDDYRVGPDRWEEVRDFNEFCRIVDANKDNIEAISFDYDLGSVKGGFDAIKYCFTKGIFPKEMIVHSSHSKGKEMYQFLLNNAPDGVEVKYSPRR